MKERTIEIIKHFALVSPKMLFLEGDNLCVTDAESAIIANAKLPEKITKEFALYDVNEFLGVYSLFENPQIAFEDNFLRISGVKNSVTYYYSSKKGVNNVYNVNVHDESYSDEGSMAGNLVAKFTLDKAELLTADKASKVLKLGDLQIKRDEVKIFNTEANDLGNEFTLHVTNFEVVNDNLMDSGDYVVFLSDMTFIPDTYHVSVYENLVEFKADNGDVLYNVVYKEV